MLKAPRSIGRDLTFAASAASSVANRMLEPHGLSLAQWAVLQCLWHNGDLSVKDIAKLTGNAPPAASRIVDRMVASGILTRQTDAKDRRAVLVRTTDRGEGLRHLQKVYEDVNAVVLSDLSEMEAETLFSLLSKVRSAGQEWLERGVNKR
ncbi:MarR family transcriptional regulator [Hasllibacter sp. MH4015]|uniref:MarR family winged helix-turn-helix transcriptional regulator n=1 Tax=Hasllibacter sp. MH4015 TaxID=2854029 RepID=UPI001CD81A49